MFWWRRRGGWRLIIFRRGSRGEGLVFFSMGIRVAEGEKSDILRKGWYSFRKSFSYTKSQTYMGEWEK